jgi:hypothetical protein
MKLIVLIGMDPEAKSQDDTLWKDPTVFFNKIGILFVV